MDETQAEEILASAADEYNAALREVARLQQRMDGLKLMATGILKMFPELVDLEVPELVEEDRPRGSDAAALVLQSGGGKWFSVQMVVKELKAREWLPEADSDNPMNATRTALERLVASSSDYRKDRGEKTGRTVYAYKPVGGHPPNEEDHRSEIDQILSGGPHPENDPQDVMTGIARTVRRSLSHNRFAGDAPGQ